MTMGSKGGWNPYEKLKPYMRIKVALILWLPFITCYSYWTYAQYLAGDLACEGTACGTIFDPIINIGVIGFVSVFLIHGIFAGLYMNQLVFRQPPWFDLHCPDCGPKRDEDGEVDPIAEILCFDGSTGPFKCNGCKLEFVVESLAQLDWPWDDSGGRWADARFVNKLASGPVMHIKPKVPFRLGPFVWRQNNPDFRSHHWELVKVIPALLFLYVLKHFSVLPEWVNWDLLFVIVFVYLSIDLFILRNRWFSETFSLPFEKWWQKEVSRHLPNWMKGVPGIWWQDQAIWIILAVLGILFFLLLGPGAFGIMSG